jgi:glycosyltransferase involved in cell wall biosynthesis
VLFAGDTLCGNIPTGLAGVLINFLKRFPKEDYNIAYANIAGKDVIDSEELKKFGEDVYEEHKDIQIFNCQLMNPKNYLNFENAVSSFKPDIVISIHDPWMMDHIYLSSQRNKFFWAAYVTIETPSYDEFVCHPTYISNTFRKSIKNVLANADLLVPVTSIGEDLFKNWGLTNYVKPIYNGLDFSNEFKGKVSKSEIFGSTVKEDDFIFCTMGINSKRKKLDLSIEAFNKFLNKIPEDQRDKYKLYLHTNVNSTAGGGTDIGNMVFRLGLGKQVLFSKELANGQFLSKKELYKKLQACDCYLGLPGGEGFGYGFAEAMLNKLPIIYSDYGGHTDFLTTRGYPVKIATLLNTEHAYFQWGHADTDYAVKLMKMVVNNEILDSCIGIMSPDDNYKFAKENFDWDKLSKRLVDNIEEKYEKYIDSRDKIFDFNLKRIV